MTSRNPGPVGFQPNTFLPRSALLRELLANKYSEKPLPPDILRVSSTVISFGSADSIRPRDAITLPTAIAASFQEISELELK
jgi:hypothetical protein